MKAPNETYAEKLSALVGSTAAKLMTMKAYQRRKLHDIADIIIEAYQRDDELLAAETWLELDDDTRSLLWLSETKKAGFFDQATKAWLTASLTTATKEA